MVVNIHLLASKVPMNERRLVAVEYPTTVVPNSDTPREGCSTRCRQLVLRLFLKIACVMPLVQLA